MLSMGQKMFTHAEPAQKKCGFACSASTEVTFKNYQNNLCMQSVHFINLFSEDSASKISKD
jgi:hypothetical protein